MYVPNHVTRYERRSLVVHNNGGSATRGASEVCSMIEEILLINYLCTYRQDVVSCSPYNPFTSEILFGWAGLVQYLYTVWMNENFKFSKRKCEKSLVPIDF